MKFLNLVILLIFVLSFNTAFSQNSFYDFVVEDIDGKEFKFSQLKGKKVMVVNVASKCGYTDQYKELEALYNKYKNQNFCIIAFPANNFLKQEPGTNNEIKEFCNSTYGVTFPLMAKISVKGKDIHPLYSWLTEIDKNKVLQSKVKWNFQKYLIDERGKLIMKIKPGTKPFDPKITDWIIN